MSVRWDVPESLDEALALRAEFGDEALLVAGGTFVGVLLSTGLLTPDHVVALNRLEALRSVAFDDDLVLGAMLTHSRLAADPRIRHGWPALAHAFEVVASPRIRNQATVAGVLGDADYASDPPAMFAALDATVWLQSSAAGFRTVPAAEFVLGHYTTALADDELITHVSVPSRWTASSYTKFRSRSSEDRPCVGVGIAARIKDGLVEELRVAIGAVADRPVMMPGVARLAHGHTPAAAASTVADGFAELVDPISDHRGSADYRRRLVRVGVRRGILALADSADTGADSGTT